jgi:hypothetical protein
MAYNKKAVSDKVLIRVREDKGLWNKVNRMYDALAQPPYSSVDIPKIPITEVIEETNTPVNSENRTAMHASTEMVNVPLIKAKISVREEIEAGFESGSMLRDAFIEGARRSFKRYFDLRVIKAAQLTTQKIGWKGDTLQYKDLIAISAKFDQLEIPYDERSIVIPATEKTDFYDDPQMQKILAYVKEYQEGAVVKVDNMDLYVSGKIPTVEGQPNVVGIWNPGTAFILANDIVPKGRYDETTMSDISDFIVRTGALTTMNEYAIVAQKGFN